MGGENNSILELSFQMGETLLRNGAEISRVQETMERVAQSYHAESFKSRAKSALWNCGTSFPPTPT